MRAISAWATAERVTLDLHSQKSSTHLPEKEWKGKLGTQLVDGSHNIAMRK
jgi:hypothetical protein